MLQEMGLGGRNFTFTEFQWFPLNKVLTCSAVKGENNSVFTKRGADYDAFLAAAIRRRGRSRWMACEPIPGALRLPGLRPLSQAPLRRMG